MNIQVQTNLAEIEAHLNRNEAVAAMAALHRLITGLPVEQIALARPDLEQLIARFQKKRQRDLTVLLEKRLSERNQGGSRSREIGPTSGASQDSARMIGERRAEYSQRLNRLRDQHIFQWSTSYRDTLGYMFKDLEQLRLPPSSWRSLLSMTTECLTSHSEAIFQRGYNYITSTLSAAEDVAVAKSIGGLQKFLFLAIDLYSSKIMDVRMIADAARLREVCSAMLLGVLCGYAKVHIGPSSGWELIEQHPLQWAHALPFLTSSDLQALLDQAPRSHFATNLAELVKPPLIAIDRLVQALPHAGASLPRVGRYWPQPPRLEVTLRSALAGRKGGARIVVLLSEVQREPTPIEEALIGGAVSVVARVEPSIWHQHEGSWHHRVVDASRTGSLSDDDAHYEHNIAELVFSALQAQFLLTPSLLPEHGTLSHNVAAEFPLGDPIIRQYYLVHRHSVKALLDTFSHGSGAHVWCSVRRSGKTTATAELAGHTDRTAVVIQTMDQQPNQPDLNIFASRVVATLIGGEPLGERFFEEVVGECLVASSTSRMQGARKSFIVDEYEMLFGLLKAAAQRDEWARYAIVQPLLSQMVAFSSTNLLVFLGQQPDAHFILMSQNQLSPLVHQQSFPLFEHPRHSTRSEFANFLAKVLAEPLSFGPDFADAVFDETSGHPYLTVNLMVDFCDWIISNRRPAGGSPLVAEDYEAFAKDRLVPAVLTRSPHYVFFQQMIADSLSAASREREPWLFAVASILQRICRQHPKVLACTEPKYKELAADVAAMARSSPAQMLQSASMANFLSIQAGHVRPAIRLLGRLAAVASGEVN